MEPLNETAIKSSMNRIDSEWIVKGKFIHREFFFKNFMEAFSFMTSVALVAEKSSHHPNWTNSYNKVTIELNTHDADGITDKDFALAEAIDKIVKK